MVINSPTTAHEEPLRPSGGQLAMDRTCLAHERTMMAWIRTSASMISFGFGIYKLLDYFQGEDSIRQGFVTPRRFAIFLIGTGLFVLACATVQNWCRTGRSLDDCAWWGTPKIARGRSRRPDIRPWNPRSYCNGSAAMSRLCNAEKSTETRIDGFWP